MLLKFPIRHSYRNDSILHRVIRCKPLILVNIIIQFFSLSCDNSQFVKLTNWEQVLRFSESGHHYDQLCIRTQRKTWRVPKIKCSNYLILLEKIINTQGRTETHKNVYEYVIYRNTQTFFKCFPKPTFLETEFIYIGSLIANT